MTAKVHGNATAGPRNPLQDLVQNISLIMCFLMLIVTLYQQIKDAFSVLMIPPTIIAFGLGITFEHFARQNEDYVPLAIPSSIALLVLLPPMIFHSTLGINFHVFLRLFKSCLLLALPGMLIMCSTIALFSLFVVDQGYHSSPWHYEELLIMSAALTATDVSAVETGALKAMPNLETLVAGESMLVDGTSYLVFEIFMSIHRGLLRHSSTIGEGFSLVFVGPIFGWLVAFATCRWVSTIRDARLASTIVVIMNWLTFIVSDRLIHTSGILSSVCFGLYIASIGKYSLIPEAQEHLDIVCEELAEWANMAIYAISGYTVYGNFVAVHHLTPDLIGYHWGVVGGIYVFIHIMRGLIILLFYPLLNSPTWGYGLNRKEAVVVLFCGLRGSVSLSLALMISENRSLSEDKRLSMTFIISGIVLFTGVLNGCGAQVLIEGLELQDTRQRQDLMDSFTSELQKHVQDETIETVLADSLLRQAYWRNVLHLLEDKSSSIVNVELTQFSPHNYDDGSPMKAAAEGKIEWFKENDDEYHSSANPKIVMCMYIALAMEKTELIEYFEKLSKEPSSSNYEASHHGHHKPHKSPQKSPRRVARELKKGQFMLDRQESLQLDPTGSSPRQASRKTVRNMGLGHNLSKIRNIRKKPTPVEMVTKKQRKKSKMQRKSHLLGDDLVQTPPQSPQLNLHPTTTIHASDFNIEGLIILIYNALRANYRNQFENNLLTDDSIVMLIEAVDCAKDHALHGDLTDLHTIIQHSLLEEFGEVLNDLEISEEGEFTREPSFITCRKFLGDDPTLSRCYDVMETLGGYIRAHQSVMQHIQHSVDFGRNNGHLKSIDHQTVRARRTLISFMLAQDQEIIIACADYILSRYLIALQRATIKELSEEGLLIPEWQNELTTWAEKQSLELPTPQSHYKDSHQYIYGQDCIDAKKTFEIWWRRLLELQKEQLDEYLKKYFKEEEEDIFASRRGLIAKSKKRGFAKLT